MYATVHQSPPGSWEKAKLCALLDQFKLTRETVENLITNLENAFKRGLEYGSPLKMIPTYVRALPDGTEEGNFFAIDLGGTNFRVLLVQLQNRDVKLSHHTYPIAKEIMTGTSDQLFDYIAMCLAKFVKEKLGSDTRKVKTVGFTFSFPVHQRSLTSGDLMEWTKGFDVDGVVHNDVVQLLMNAIKKRDEVDVDQIALLNDTTGVMMSCAYSHPDVMIGAILGTGSNACYMEVLENLSENTNYNNGKDLREDKEPKQMIINTEWGAFGDNGDLKDIVTPFDKQLDDESLYPGKQTFEKMISGMYLGEIVRQCLLSLIADFVLFRGHVSEVLKKKDSFTTVYISEFCSGEAKTCVGILKKLGYENATIEDCRVIQDICVAVSLRAARLAAAGLTCILRRLKRRSVAVAMDGSLYKKHPTFKTFMHNALDEFLPTTQVTLHLAEDGSGIGAAVVAAVADRLNRTTLVD